MGICCCSRVKNVEIPVDHKNDVVVLNFNENYKADQHNPTDTEKLPTIKKNSIKSVELKLDAHNHSKIKSDQIKQQLDERNQCKETNPESKEKSQEEREKNRDRILKLLAEKEEQEKKDNPVNYYMEELKSNGKELKYRKSEFIMSRVKLMEERKIES